MVKRAHHLLFSNSLCAIGGGAATEGALWKLGNKGLGILLAEVYVREGD
jgi:hypothetical protein